MYKYDMHVHDKLGSLCASCTPEEIVDAYAKKGMNGFVSTNHFIHGNTAVDRNLPWKNRMMEYYRSYEIALAAAKKYKDFTVFFGFEHAYAGGREVLVYGSDIDFLINHPEIEKMAPEDFCKLLIDAGCVVATAHPYRERAYNDNSVNNAPLFVNAVEVYNACNTEQENMKAFKYASENNFIFVSGGDTHHTDTPTIGKAGIATEKPIADSAVLVSVLKSGNYKLIIDGKIID